MTAKTQQELQSQHYEDMKRHIEANGKRHPWYGPCDGLGDGGSCSICDDLAIHRQVFVRSATVLEEAVDDMMAALEKAKG